MVVVVGGRCGWQEMGLGLKIGEDKNRNRSFRAECFWFWG